MVTNSTIKRKRRKAQPKIKQVDLVATDQEKTGDISSSGVSKTVHRRWPIFALIFGLGLLVVGSVMTLWAAARIFQSIDIQPRQLWNQYQTGQLKSDNNRTNILLLGKGDTGHEAADLTDSMQIVSLHSEGASQPVVIALPRDLWSETLKDRINTAYYYGKIQNRQGGGLGFAKEIVTEKIGIPIHYAVVVDFTVFQEVIDLVKGIDVNVSQGFVDPNFPIAGKENDLCNGDPEYKCRYQTVAFETGRQFMDGEKALTYIRSRHAIGDQGTDFARGTRLQEVIQALVERLLEPRQWLTVEVFKQGREIVNQHVETDITSEEILALVRTALSLTDSFEPVKVNIEPWLTNPSPRNYGGKYVLIPAVSEATFREIIAASISGNNK